MSYTNTQSSSGGRVGSWGGHRSMLRGARGVVKGKKVG
jgi:hypothetical protein